MIGSTYIATNYRYGFNGKEKDDETYGGGNEYDFGSRIYDPRIGRWLSLDPLQARYASISPYAFCANNPIACIDPDGKGVVPVPTTSSYNGPANPANTGDIGNTTGKYTLTPNSVTNEYDIQINVHIEYSSAFSNPGANGKTLEQENPGLGLAVKTHEDFHADANVAAAYHTFTYTSDLLGSDKPLTGRVDEIATKLNQAYTEHKNILFKEIDDKIEKKYETLIQNANTVEEINEYRKQKSLESGKQKQAVIDDNNNKFQGELNELINITKDIANELNTHSGKGGINDKTSTKLSGTSSQGYQDGTKKIKSQGTEVPNSEDSK